MNDRPPESTESSDEPTEPSDLAMVARHRRVSLAAFVLGLLLIGAVFLTPVLFTAKVALVWWVAAGAAGFLLATQAISLVQFYRTRRTPRGPPLERPEQAPLDFDAPWREEGLD